MMLQTYRAFELAGQRYEELKPVLDRLNELEEEQVGIGVACLAGIVLHRACVHLCMCVLSYLFISFSSHIS